MRLEERRDIHPTDAGKGSQQLAAILPIPRKVRVADLVDGVLAVSQQHGVEEVGQRLGVERAWTAGDHQRVATAAICGAQGNATQVQHCQQVRVRELVLQREADDVERLERGQVSNEPSGSPLRRSSRSMSNHGA